VNLLRGFCTCLGVFFSIFLIIFSGFTHEKWGDFRYSPVSPHFF
jgi:hypothetical protein